MINKNELYKWWDVFKNGGDLTEIRILDGSKTYSGYFKDIGKIIETVELFDEKTHGQMYFTLNKINEACYGA